MKRLHALLAFLVVSTCSLQIFARVEVPFLEDFKNNRNDWPWIGNESASESKIKRGTLLWKNKSDDPDSYQKTYLETDLDDRRDYRLSISLRYVEGDRSADFGVQWMRSDDPTTYHEMRLNADGRFFARTWKDNSAQTLVEATILENLNADDFNELTVEKIADTVYFSANGRFIGHAPANPATGRNIALTVFPGATVAFDKLQVSYLEAQEANSIRESYVSFLRSHPEKAVVLDEPFDDNRNNWPFLGERDSTFIEIADGTLFYENFDLDGTNMQTSIPIALNSDLDFAIDAELKLESGTDNRAYGLAWGRGENSARHYFGLSGDGSYIIDVYDGSNWLLDSSWVPNPSVVNTSGESNRISVRKIGSTVFCLVNDQAVADYPFTELYGSMIGVFLPQGSAIEADSIQARYLTEPQADRQLQATRLVEDIYAYRLGIGPELRDLSETFDDNRNNWPWIEEDDKTAKRIEDGRLYFENKTDSYFITTLNRAIHPTADFELSTTVRYVSGARNNLVGLRFGRTSGGRDDISFGIAFDGHYILGAQHQGKWESLIPWTKSNLIKQDADNQLALRRVQDTFFLFINGTLVADYPAQELPGPFQSVIVSGGIAASFDDFALRYFPRTQSESVRAKETLEEELRKRYSAGEIAGVYHHQSKLEAAASERKKQRERERELAKASQLNDKDYKALSNARKRFNAKNRATVVAAWGQPHIVNGDRNGPHRIYYRYKMKGNTQYYYEFQIYYTASKFDMHGKPIPLDERFFGITNITLTDRPW